ncbi:MAG: hypothetical protein IT546_06435, partial [Caulobacteraceae bacterium]|nr:hypothetical protein [Caulobacteraceae bacterium]
SGALTDSDDRAGWLATKQRLSYDEVRYDARAPQFRRLPDDGAVISFTQAICLSKPGTTYSSLGDLELTLERFGRGWSIKRSVFRRQQRGKSCL